MKGSFCLKSTFDRRQLLLCLVPLLLALCLIFVVTKQNQITVHKNAVILRQGPGLTYAPVKQETTETVRIIGQSNSWYKLRIGDHQIAWAPAWRLKNQTKFGAHNALSEATIVVDAGHGGSDSGAEYHDNSNNPKYMEKTYTLALAKRVANKLRAQGARVIMTRDNDQFVDLKPRPKMAEEAKADVFISFHYDSSPQANEGSGVTTYYYHRGASRELAQIVNRQFSALPLKNLGINFGDFLVIRENTQPAILCEMGYINTKKDFHQIKTVRYQNQVANEVVTGLNQFCQNRAGK
ncbi:MAG TPA: N-acetylmuramoyl-L-alanine amidase [Candidatus Limosilactobacillus faecipullorum]|nr:N-acetylmuramoyl-L-alanine amidase [Candidatus Limosilactobacillus faecipullorum]